MIDKIKNFFGDDERLLCPYGRCNGNLNVVDSKSSSIFIKFRCERCNRFCSMLKNECREWRCINE